MIEERSRTKRARLKGFILNRVRLVIYPLILIAVPSFAFADAGVPMIALMYPALLLALIPVVFLEAEIFRRRISTSYGNILKAVAAANAVSTILGYPLSWVLLFGIELLLTTMGHALVLRGVWAKAASVIFQAAWLAPYESDLYWMIPAAALVGLIPAYFISVYSEAYVVRRLLRESRQKILPVSWVANLWSYGLLVTLCLAYGSYSFSERGHPPLIVNFSPKSVVFKSMKPFFYEDEYKNVRYSATGIISNSDRIVWKGELGRRSLVSPDSTKILFVSAGELKVLSSSGSVETIVKVKSMWNRGKKDIGTEYWREEGWQWSPDSASVFLIKDVFESSTPSQWFSKKGSLFRFSLQVRQFEKVLDPFLSYEVYPGVSGNEIFYSKAIDHGNKGFYVYDLKAKREELLYASTGTKDSRSDKDINKRIFFDLSHYESEYTSMQSEFSRKSFDKRYPSGFYKKEGHREKCLLSIEDGTGGYQGDGIGDFVIIPGGRFLLVDVNTANYRGTLVFDLNTGDYGKFLENVRLYFSVTSSDLSGRFFFTASGLQSIRP